jgi:hypothetical protein
MKRLIKIFALCYFIPILLVLLSLTATGAQQTTLDHTKDTWHQPPISDWFETVSNGLLFFTFFSFIPCTIFFVAGANNQIPEIRWIVD